MTIRNHGADTSPRMFDAVHGAIDLHDLHGRYGTLRAVLACPAMQRLRRIKQLGFASDVHPSAEHSRFGHSIGTMQVMRRLLEKDTVQHGIGKGSRSEWGAAFPQTFSRAWDAEKMMHHMLVAALFQDIGELPYGAVTERLIGADKRVFQVAESGLGTTLTNRNDWSSKRIFAIAALYHKSTSPYMEGLDRELLSFLITGHSNRPTGLPQGALAARQMLNGAVDADRMDYVVRDAFHTSGYRMDLSALHETLARFDASGPIFTDPGPVMTFLTARTHLWVNVYMSPANRFKNLLLRKILLAVKRHPECQMAFFGRSDGFRMLFEDFQAWDDGTLYAGLRKLNEDSKARKLLPASEQRALEFLTVREPEYDSLWVPSRAENKAPALTLPDDLFFDTYSDYREDALYEEGSVRIEAGRYAHLGKTIPLEQCSGPFNALLTGAWSAVPMPRSVLLFRPRERDTATWKRVDQALATGELHAALMRQDPFGVLDLPTDTRRTKDFRGPNVFVSFTWADIEVVRLIIEALHSMRRQYRVLAGTFQGLGETTAENSRRGVNEAEGVIVLLSRDYVERYRTEPDGNVAAEFIELVKDREKPRVFLSMHSHRELQGKLPFGAMGIAAVPFIGLPLQGAQAAVVREAVTEALKSIDDNVLTLKRRPK